MAKRFIIKMKTGGEDRWVYLGQRTPRGVKKSFATKAIDQARLYKASGHAEQTLRYCRAELRRLCLDALNEGMNSTVNFQIIPVKVEVYAASI